MADLCKRAQNTDILGRDVEQEHPARSEAPETFNDDIQHEMHPEIDVRRLLPRRPATLKS